MPLSGGSGYRLTLRFWLLGTAKRQDLVNSLSQLANKSLRGWKIKRHKRLDAIVFADVMA